ncbi:hypothetical protein ACJMK2_005202 [Sinanodonta woodiana]|uniref:Uncharacterized protein n=1 Tax=Sinanodonta woodiana TaxID=1069815 RepID=A0ABD3VQX2_SINWO
MSLENLDSANSSVPSPGLYANDIYAYDLYNRFVACTSGSDATQIKSTTMTIHEKGHLRTMFEQYIGENDMKPLTPDVNFRRLYTNENYLNAAILKTQHTQNYVSEENNLIEQDYVNSVLDKSLSVAPRAIHYIHVRNSKCENDTSTRCLTQYHPVAGNARDHVSDCPVYQKTAREAGVDLRANKHNHCNREMHDCLWCPCIFYFMFLFCIPAMLLMQFSDTAFQKGEDSKAKRYATCSTMLYVLGLALSITFYATMVLLIMHFNNYI